MRKLNMKASVAMQRPANDVEIWDKWNSTYRQGTLDSASKGHLRAIGESMRKLHVKDAKIFEAGCGTGWLSAALSEFGDVTACDLGMQILEVAKKKYPQVKFLSGDVHSLELPVNHFDVVVTEQVLAHVADQPAFIHRLGELLKPGGYLVITTQNKYVFDRTENISPPDGWIRRWVTMSILKGMLRNEFSIRHATTLEPDRTCSDEFCWPEGHIGFLRIVNSKKVNRLLSSILGPDSVKRLKESAGFGQSLFVIASKR